MAPRTVRRTTARQRLGATSTSSNIRRGCMPVCRVSGARIAVSHPLPLGTERQRLHAPVRSSGHDPGHIHAGRRGGAAARLVGEHDTRLWRVIHHYVEEPRGRADASDVTRLAIDETAARRGHDYITLFVDIDEARVVHVTEGKDAATVAAFAGDLIEHGGDPDQITEVCIDMSPPLYLAIAGRDEAGEAIGGREPAAPRGDRAREKARRPVHRFQREPEQSPGPQTEPAFARTGDGTACHFTELRRH